MTVFLSFPFFQQCRAFAAVSVCHEHLVYQRRTRAVRDSVGAADAGQARNDIRAAGNLIIPHTTPTTPMTYVWMIIIGLIVGAVAKFLMPGKDPGGFIVTILIGIAGALVAGFLGRAMGWYAEGESAGFIASVIGAILLLIVYRLATKGSRTAG
jgi:uncharacterized membrane protein YeaQ/YmgE (transglycosylase-associated protein family)